MIQGEVPIISDLSKLVGQGPVTVLDLLEAISGNDLSLLRSILQMIKFVNSLPTDANLMIPLGGAGARQVHGQRRPRTAARRSPRRRTRASLQRPTTADDLVDDFAAGSGYASDRRRAGEWHRPRRHVRRLRPDLPVLRRRRPDLRRPDGQGRDAHPLRRRLVRRGRGLRLLLPADPDRARADPDLHRRLVPRRRPLRDRLRHVRPAQGARGRHRHAPARRHLLRRLRRQRRRRAGGQVHRPRVRRGLGQRLHLQGRDPRRDHLHHGSRTCTKTSRRTGSCGSRRSSPRSSTRSVSSTSKGRSRRRYRRS